MPLEEEDRQGEGLSGELLTLTALISEQDPADMSGWSQAFLSFNPFQTLASSGILVFRSHRRQKSGRERSGSASHWQLRLGGQTTGTPGPTPGWLSVASQQAQVRVVSGGAPPRGQRGQQGFMGKDLSAIGEDILPAFPSSCCRSPRPDLAALGGHL